MSVSVRSSAGVDRAIKVALGRFDFHKQFLTRIRSMYTPLSFFLPLPL